MTTPPVMANTGKPAITFVITSLFKGGAETQMMRLALGLAERGWRVRIVTLMLLNDFREPLDAAGITVDTLAIPRGRYDPTSLPRLVRILSRHKPDVVCTFMYHANVVGRLAARLAGVSVIVSSIRNAVFGGWVADRLMALTDGIATKTTTNSELAGQALVARGVVRPARLRVIPNAIDLTQAAKRCKSRDELLGAELGSRWLWLSVGRLEPQKAHENTLEAIAALVAEGRDVHLAIAGNGGLKESLLELRSALGLEDRVTLLDYSLEVPDLMAVADAFVLASRWEGLPNVVLEASLEGLPVVSTDVGGVREIITDGQTGILSAPNDVGALTDAMRRMMDTPAETKVRMAMGAREHVLETYSPGKVIDTWEGMFLELVKQRKSA